MDFVTERGQHPPNLAVLTFVEHHLEHGALLVLRADRHPLGMHLGFSEADAAPEAIEQFLAGHAGDLHEVLLLDTVARMGEKVGESPVVGEEDQPLAHAVEPANREQPLLAGHEVDDTRSPRRIGVGGHHADRLVEHVDDPLRIGQPLAVDTNLLGARIDAGAERGHHLPVDLDAARRDQFLAGATTAESGRREHLLEPLTLVIGSASPDGVARGERRPRRTPADGPGRTTGATRTGCAARTGGTAGAATGRTRIGGGHGRVPLVRWREARQAQPADAKTESYIPPPSVAGHCSGCDHHRARFTSATGSA